MKLRHPPGRAGRPWLTQRLAAARRGAELLDTKHRALMSERRRLEPLVAEALSAWADAARAAERALARAAVLGGERQIDIARRAAREDRAEVTVHWRAILGVTCPAGGEVDFSALPEPAALSASAALLTARQLHHGALEAAVQFAVLSGALRRVDHELRVTTRRRNAVERRWIPAHEAALADLELSLEELEREDATRVRWTAARTGQTPD